MQSQELSDYIGAESCVDFRPDVANIVSNGGAGLMNPSRCQRRSEVVVEKEYPPSIHLPSHAAAWVMKKYSTNDGRLVIREEKVRRHEYFQAHRSDGRLLLRLFPLDDDAAEESCEEHLAGDNGVEEFDFQENVEVSGEEINGGDKRISDLHPSEEVHFKSNNYNMIGVNPCGGLAVAAGVSPPVHM